MNEEILVDMKQLQKALGKSRATIFNYIKQGMPHIKRGRMNMFDLKTALTWQSRYQTGSDYLHLMTEAKEKYPDQPLNRLMYIQQNGSHRDYAIALAETAQNLFSDRVKRDVKMDGGKIDPFLRGLLHALKQIPGADEEAFKYIAVSIDAFIKDSIRQALPAKLKAKVFITFLEKTFETEDSFDKRWGEWSIAEESEFFIKQEG